MKFAFYIARHYLFSKKKSNLINLISAVSIAWVTTGAIALIVILSVLNGFNGLIKSLFNHFDPEIKITSTTGKFFESDSRVFDKIGQMEDIAVYTEVIEEKAMLQYNNRQVVASVKGVPPGFKNVSGIESRILDGDYLLEKDGFRFALVGAIISSELSVGLKMTDPIYLYYPKTSGGSTRNLAYSYNQKTIFPSGIFSIHQDVDSKYILVPISFARELFNIPDKISAIELKLSENSDVEEVQDKITRLLGDDFRVLTRFQQNEVLYKTINMEKWMILLILCFILLIASFSILGSISMLIADKKDDIATLRSMGANTRTIRNIFLLEGWLISVVGVIIGLIIGLFICWLQMRFGLIRFPSSGSFIVNAYPVEIQIPDIFIVLVAVLGIGFFTAFYPVRFISGKYLQWNNE